MSHSVQPDRLTYLQNFAPKIFNFEEAFDVTIFDELIKSLYHGEGNESQFAKNVLEEFLLHDSSWLKVDAILENSSSDESRFYALLVLEKLVKSRWKMLPNEQRIGIRDYIVQQIISVGSQEHAFDARKLYLNKLACVLVEILKHEWPRRWSEFMAEIVQSSKISENLSLINMKILRLFSEEIFIFSSQMNHNKTNLLKEAFVEQFPVLYSHIYAILTESTNVPLIVECLKTLAGFMAFIPRRFIFNSTLVELLIERFFKEPVFSNDTLACLSEIMAIKEQDSIDTRKKIYMTVLDKMNGILPYSFDFNMAFNQGTEVQQRFLRMIAMFFTQSLRDFQALIRAGCDVKLIADGLEYVHSATQIQDVEIFKICIEFWSVFTKSIRLEQSRSEMRTDIPSRIILREVSPVLAKLRLTVIVHMRRPEEVIIFVNEHGEVVRQFMRDTDAIALYTACKDTLVNLTVLDSEQVKQIIFERLDMLMLAPDFSWHDLNCIGWAVGSISMSMPVEMEREFIVKVLKNLLTLCDEKRGKDNKAIIASNIMYVVMNYPRFLKPYYRFLKTVSNKLFEFMAETHEGVQDMACDTFLKIARSCRVQLAKPQPDETLSYIQEYLPTMHTNLTLLNVQQLEMVFEAIGTVIHAVDNTNEIDRLIILALDPYSLVWVELMKAVNIGQIGPPLLELVFKSSILLKMAAAMSKTVGEQLDVFMTRIFAEMLQTYTFLSQVISQQIANLGPQAAMFSEVKTMRIFKRDVLNLIEFFILHSRERLDSLKDKYFSAFVNCVLVEYNSAPPSSRQPEVLSATTAFVSTFKSRVNDQIITVFQMLFDSTLSMINQDMQEYPEHRFNFFKLISSIVSFCFEALVAMKSTEFDFIMRALIFGMTHTSHNISSVALTSLISIFKNLLGMKYRDTPFIAEFNRSYYLTIIDGVLVLLTDGMHAADFPDHCFILSHLLLQLDNNRLGIRLSEDPSLDNITFFKNHCVLFLKQQFAHLTDQQLVLFVDGLMCFYGNEERFIPHIRDFILQLKEYQGSDAEDLFVDQVHKEMNDIISKRFQEFGLGSDGSTSRSLHDYHTVA